MNVVGAVHEWGRSAVQASPHLKYSSHTVMAEQTQSSICGVDTLRLQCSSFQMICSYHKVCKNLSVSPKCWGLLLCLPNYLHGLGQYKVRPAGRLLFWWHSGAYSNSRRHCEKMYIIKSVKQFISNVRKQLDSVKFIYNFDMTGIICKHCACF